MLLYHFTAAEYLESIESEGLTRGNVPTRPGAKMQGVWLTTDRDPSGHGLSDGHVLPGKQIQIFQRILGRPLSQKERCPPDKRAIRITVKIRRNDRKLAHWPEWARKRLNPKWYKALSRTGGYKDGTWYVYFGVIPPDWFTEIEDLRHIR